MSEDSRIDALLDRWRTAHDQGLKLDLTELCKDSPELLDEVRRRLPPATHVTSGVDTDMGRPRTKTQGDLESRDPGQLGGFRLVRELGRGGMGIVYEAEDATLGRRVALKTLHTELAADEESRQRFLREARAAAALRHDHVVTLHQVGQDGNTPFLVMEYLAGESLADRLMKRSPMPIPEAVRIAKEMAEGLAAAHDKGLVHRDVKPANVWLEAPKGRVKLLDFGLARLAQGPSLTAVGTVAGTVGYMAPEQIYGGQLDGRTDLYALGCVLYQMLWDEMPFQKQDTMALLEATISQDAPKLDTVAKSVPAPLGSLLRRLLARNPDARPPSASVVAAELAEIEGHLVHPERASHVSTEFRRAASQGRGIGMWAGITVVLLAVGIGAFALFTRMSKHPDDGDGKNALAATGPTGPPIRIGVLHSITGASRDSEGPMTESIFLAKDEINAAGGVLGRPIELVMANPNAIDSEYSRLADKLITQDQVSAIFGCWTSSSRREVAEICKKHQNLLVHSVINEGLEEHPNVINVGGGPNLQLHEAVNYVRFTLLKKRFFLIGSDSDLYSHAAHEILKDDIEEFGGTVVGNEFIQVGTGDVSRVVELLKAAKPDVIFNSADAPTNLVLNKYLPKSGINSKEVPTVWVGIGEEEMGALNRRQMIGDLCATPYFHSLDTPSNQAFLKRLAPNFSYLRASDATEAAYCAMYLWKQAVEAAGTPEPMKVRDAFRGQSFQGPEGLIKIDPGNLYAWRSCRVAEMRANKDDEPIFVVVKSTDPIAPVPFPKSRTREAWESFLSNLYKSWGGWTRQEKAP